MRNKSLIERRVLLICKAAFFAAVMISLPLHGIASRAVQSASSPAVESQDTLYLSLEGAVKLTLEHNEDVKIAEAALDKAHGRKQEAFASALPSISAEAGYTRNILRPVIFFPDPDTDDVMKIEIGEKNDFRVGLYFTQPLYAFGRIGGAIKVADYFLRSSEKDLSNAKQEVVLEVKEAYYGALLAEEVLKISRQTLRQAERHFEETVSKLKQQMAAKFDSLRAKVKVKNILPLVIASENARTLALLELKRITGIENRVPLKLTDRLDFIPGSYDLEETMEEAIANRPDVAALRLRALMSEKVYKVTKRFNYPFLSLVGNYLVQGQESEKFFPSGDKIAKSFAVGVSLSFPVFDGFANRGKTAQAKADLGITRYALQKMEKVVELQITQLYSKMNADRKSLKSQEATVEMAEEAYRLALVRFRNGLSTSLELSDTELALTNARLNYLEAVYRCIITKERLENAMGY